MKDNEKVFLLHLTQLEADVLSTALYNYVQQENCPEPLDIQRVLLNVIRRLDSYLTSKEEG